MNSRNTDLTFKNRTYPPDADGTLPIVLAEDEFHVKKGNSAENQHQRVGDKERTWGKSTVKTDSGLNHTFKYTHLK